MKVYLLGFMGSGKSTVGRLLADQMKLDFIDFDRYIEQETGKTIAELFDSGGEDKFRELEHLHLKKILSKDNVVIALGGGTPCFHDNMNLIQANGKSVYLKVDAEILLKRLIKGKAKRPLIRDLNETELKHFIEDRLAKRISYYSKADFTLQVGKMETKEVTYEVYKIASKKA